MKHRSLTTKLVLSASAAALALGAVACEVEDNGDAGFDDPGVEDDGLDDGMDDDL